MRSPCTSKTSPKCPTRRSSTSFATSPTILREDPHEEEKNSAPKASAPSRREGPAADQTLSRQLRARTAQGAVMILQRKEEELVHVRLGEVELEGALGIPKDPKGLVLFAHGSGSSRHSPRNQFVSRRLQGSGLGTFLVDLLSPEEDQNYARRFDIDFLVDR